MRPVAPSRGARGTQGHPCVSLAARDVADLQDPGLLSHTRRHTVTFVRKSCAVAVAYVTPLPLGQTKS